MTNFHSHAKMSPLCLIAVYLEYFIMEYLLIHFECNWLNTFLLLYCLSTSLKKLICLCPVCFYARTMTLHRHLLHALLILHLDILQWIPCCIHFREREKWREREREKKRKKQANTVYYMYNLYLMHLNSCAEYETEIVMGSN